MQHSRERCLFYSVEVEDIQEVVTHQEESIGESVCATCANPQPMGFDVACVSLDAEDIEVSVHVMDPNLEFLEDKIEIALTQVNMSPRRPRRLPSPLRSALAAAQHSTFWEQVVGTDCPTRAS